jgi:hypothetical protein
MILQNIYEDRRDYSATTPLTTIRPESIQVLPTDSGTLATYQKRMSKATWRPAPGRKLGFLVVQDDALLGLVFLASPVIRLAVRDERLFPNADKDFNYGLAMRSYMDMSVCVASQPIGWHWNLGKLMALISPTLGDYVNARYPSDLFKGVTTTSLWGKSSQYNRIYKHLGYTKGNGHEHVNDETYHKMVEYLKARCPHCNPGCENPLALIPSRLDAPVEEWCALPSPRFGEGANTRMRRIGAYFKATGNKTLTLTHGKVRGVYYHPAVPPDQRPAIIQNWYERWGLPRYERTKNEVPPYQSGLEGKPS